MASPRRDIYQEITNKIIAMLEEGKRPWLQPWQDGEGAASFPIRSTGEPYRGINVLLLWSEAAEKGYNSPYWFTFKQAAALKANVRKGEKGTTIVYAGSIQRTDTDENTGEDIEQNIPFMKAYTVFNACQIDGLDASYFTNENVPELLSEAQRIAAVDTFFKNTGADIRHGGNKAFYRPSGDYIQMPNFVQFTSPEAYASTLAHEMCHWTKAPKRLNRDFGAKAFGDEGYGREELVAEIGSAFLGADLGFEVEPRPDHAAYISGWLTVLKNDKRAIFQAAANAQRACDFLHSLQPTSQQAALAA
ncbi:ArdC family protein [Ochrobactrum soli]|uniref:DUF1738 domain-containing protein n=1 Tax=Ochrobactrum soli TaxID=2448455 RepID=A0A849KT90_9HYPH|nr:zincin-like metallopeptidase domain-containing protein [[Ochrobactrum] soli]NNU62987.1 DUF1738 domain-containing protein [[Ochrobactrum] soli]